jgi:hypothetical protein
MSINNMTKLEQKKEVRGDGFDTTVGQRLLNRLCVKTSFNNCYTFPLGRGGWKRNLSQLTGINFCQNFISNIKSERICRTVSGAVNVAVVL